MKHLAHRFILALAIFGSALDSARAQTTTAFTYQGRLNVSGSPANGLYDFTFRAFDAVTAGSSSGGVVSVNAVGVTNGVFTAAVDLGATPFTGPARWLQIAVSTNGAGNYSTLSPRQQLTPTPYAIYANTAGTVTNGAIANAQLAASSVAAANLQNGTITAGKIASGQVVKNLNGLNDAVSIAAGANVTLSTNGNSLQISAPAGGLTLPYSGNVASGGAAFSVSNSVSGNHGQFGTASAGISAKGYGSGSDAVFASHSPSGNVGVLASPTFGTYGAHAVTGNYGYLGVGADGVEGYGNNLSSSGVFGRNVPTFNYGGLGSPAAGAFGVSGDFGTSGYLGTAVFGVVGQATASGEATGVIGTNAPSGNYGLLGHSGFGADGVAKTAGAVGTRGIHLPSGNYGQLGTSITGVRGVISTFTSAPIYAVLGEASTTYGALGALTPLTGSLIGVFGSSPSGFAGRFEGYVEVNGHSDYVAAGIWRPNDGVLINFGTSLSVGNISVAGTTVSYNAFTGSHYAQTDEKIERGALVTLTGTNSYSGTNLDSEIIYGIARSIQADDPRCLGAYLSVQTPSKPASAKNPHLVMAVGNGDMWVTKGGNGNLELGNYLISSDVPGCAMKDNPERFPIGYICARAAEGVKWSEIKPDAHGIKRKKISVLFESFERHSGGGVAVAVLKAQQVRIDALESELKSMRGLKSQLATIKALLEGSETKPLTASLKNGGAK